MNRIKVIISSLFLCSQTSAMDFEKESIDMDTKPFMLQIHEKGVRPYLSTFDDHISRCDEVLFSLWEGKNKQLENRSQYFKALNTVIWELANPNHKNHKNALNSYSYTEYREALDKLLESLKETKTISIEKFLKTITDNVIEKLNTTYLDEAFDPIKLVSTSLSISKARTTAHSKHLKFIHVSSGKFRQYRDIIERTKTTTKESFKTLKKEMISSLYIQLIAAEELYICEDIFRFSHFYITGMKTLSTMRTLKQYQKENIEKLSKGFLKEKFRLDLLYFAAQTAQLLDENVVNKFIANEIPPKEKEIWDLALKGELTIEDRNLWITRNNISKQEISNNNSNNSSDNLDDLPKKIFYVGIDCDIFDYIKHHQQNNPVWKMILDYQAKEAFVKFDKKPKKSSISIIKDSPHLKTKPKKEDKTSTGKPIPERGEDMKEIARFLTEKHKNGAGILSAIDHRWTTSFKEWLNCDDLTYSKEELEKIKEYLEISLQQVEEINDKDAKILNNMVAYLENYGKGLCVIL